MTAAPLGARPFLFALALVRACYLCKSLTMGVRITIAVARVLQQFVAAPDEPRYGYELIEATGFASGKLYPILQRLTSAGWLVKEREDIDPAAAGRPARTYYRITPTGLSDARIELARLSTQVAPSPVRRARPAGETA